MGTSFTSAVGHASTADFLTQLLGINIAMQRITISMEPGDLAIVLKMHTRLPEGAILNVDEIRNLHFEFGLLEKIN